MSYRRVVSALPWLFLILSLGTTLYAWRQLMTYMEPNPLDLRGASETFAFSALSALDAVPPRHQPLLMLVGGGVVSLLLFCLM